MRKEQKIQLSLFFLGIALILLTYFYIPSLNKDKYIKDQSIQKDLKEDSDDQTTVMYNVKYLGRNVHTPFTLMAETAKIKKKEFPDLIDLNNIHLILHLKDRQIDIYAKNGNFNKTTNDVYMTGAPGDPIQAIETPGTTTIYADNMNLLSTSSEVEIFNNVSIVDEKGSSLRAHSIKYNFLQKLLKTTSENNKNIQIKIIK